MLIREAMRASHASKEVKVRIPVQHHVRLLTLKVLTGLQISDAVAKALDDYFGSQAYLEALGRHQAMRGDAEG